MRKACLTSFWLFAACSQVEVLPLDLEPSFDCEIPVDGHKALLKFDTGAMGTLFDRSEAELLSLKIERTDATLISTDSSGAVATSNDFTHDVVLRFGNLTCTVRRLPVLALDPRFTRADQTQQQHRLGLVGMDVMQLYAMWFDAPNKQMHVVPADQAESFVAARGRVITERIKLTGDLNRPMIHVVVENDRAIELLLDTGASATCLPHGLAAELNLPSGAALEEQRRQENIARMTKQLEDQGLTGVKVEVGARDGSTIGIHGQATSARTLHHLRSLKIGKRELTDLIVTEDDESSVLGADVLSTFEWLLHGPKRELWLVEVRQ